jgi:hypothetical protein
MNDWNYYMDARVIAGEAGSWYSHLDEQKMIATIDDGADWLDDEEQEIPFKWEICPTCQGKGTHVNPAIDCGGISGEQFAEDPGFMHDYVNGLYDQPCNECHGRRVVAEPALEEHAKAYERWLEAEIKYQSMCAMERAVGA